jgi:hypothetical protein
MEKAMTEESASPFGDVKSILQSTTVRALALAAIAKLAGDALPPEVAGAGYDLLARGVEFAADVVQYAALVVAGWGRVKAKEKLT